MRADRRIIDRDRVARLWEQGLSSAQISERLGVGRRRMAQILTEMKLPILGSPRRTWNCEAGGTVRSSHSKGRVL